MNDNELKALFDQMAPGYDKQWERTAPINQCLYFLLESVFAAVSYTHLTLPTTPYV